MLSSWIALWSVVAEEAVEELVGRRLRWWWKRLRRTEEVVVVVAVVREGAGLDAMGFEGGGVGVGVWVEWWRGCGLRFWDFGRCKHCTCATRRLGCGESFDCVGEVTREGSAISQKELRYIEDLGSCRLIGSGNAIFVRRYTRT